MNKTFGWLWIPIFFLAIHCGGSVTPGSPTATPTPSQPPSGLTYSTNPAIYVKGEKISPNTPSTSGGAPALYTVSPNLPAGLMLDGTTGVITGTPTTTTPAADVTVTASNILGNTTFHRGNFIIL
jgi:hypothetical protein